jgi:N-acetylglucosaminyl-diphospho-decaprenol L-rhamnosyltransferase
VPPKIYIIVPVFNRKLWTKQFLYCLRRQTFRNFEIIVVDDGSTDGTTQLVRNEFTEAKLLRGDGNLWWTGAINLGIRYVMSQALATDSVLVINDDVEVDPNYLEVLYRLWQSMPHTLIGSILVDIENPDVIYNGGNMVNWWTAKFTVLNRGERLANFDKDQHIDVSFLTGRGTLIPVQVFRDIGVYDDKHFQQCGDTELTVRAKKAGYRLIVSYSAIVKSPLTTSDHLNVSDHYSLKDLRPYFLGIRSNCRLKYRFFFSLKTATSTLQLISFLTLDVLRVTCHFLLRLKFT